MTDSEAAAHTRTLARRLVRTAAAARRTATGAAAPWLPLRAACGDGLQGAAVKASDCMVIWAGPIADVVAFSVQENCTQGVGGVG